MRFGRARGARRAGGDVRKAAQLETGAGAHVGAARGVGALAAVVVLPVARFCVGRSRRAAAKRGEEFCDRRRCAATDPLCSDPHHPPNTPPRASQTPTTPRLAGAWQKTMAAARRAPDAVAFCSRAGMLSQMRDAVEALDVVQRALGAYLEAKRKAAEQLVQNVPKVGFVFLS